MSTKINVRSPYYIDVQEPTRPVVELTCALIALQGFAVDEFGNVSLPNPAYGDILSYSSTDSDFADGKFDTVSTDTSRTVTFRISIPDNFSNSANDYIECDATTIQTEFVCTGGVTTNGSIPNQSLNTGGNTATIDLSSYFTQGVDPIAGYNITNSYPSYIETSISGNTLTISAKQIAGTITFFVEAFDNDIATCNATQSIQVTLTSLVTYDCDDSYLSGGIVNQDGSIINPNVNGVITAIRETALGSPITSLPANNTGSSIEHTLFFDITVPTGYTNVGNTVQCSKDFTQVSSTLPEFTCDVASLTGQGIYLSGAILTGNTEEGTISRFTPTRFAVVNSTTSRNVTFFVTPPASGYSNSGGDDIQCEKTLTQPAIEVGCGNEIYYIADTAADLPSEIITLNSSSSYNHYLVGFEIYAQSSTFDGLIGDNLCWSFLGKKRAYNATTGDFKFQLIRKTPFNINGVLKNKANADYDYYVGVKGTVIQEVWLYSYVNETFIQVA
jgi:hypothetical protein